MCKFHDHARMNKEEKKNQRLYQGCGSGGSGIFCVEAKAEAQKIHHFRFHIGGKNVERKEIGSAILCRRTN